MFLFFFFSFLPPFGKQISLAGNGGGEDMNSLGGLNPLVSLKTKYFVLKNKMLMQKANSNL